MSDFNKEVIVKIFIDAKRDNEIPWRMIQILMNQDLQFPSVYRTVDEKALNRSYFAADYTDTIDIYHAL